MNLSSHFTLEEMTSTKHKELQDDPDAEAMANLKRLCVFFLEPVRELLGVPMGINSGYRGRLVNAKVGGVPTSAHRFGRAADFVPHGYDLDDAFECIRRTDLPYDQLILENKGGSRWIHLGIAPEGTEPRRQAMVAEVDPLTNKASYRRVNG